MGTLNEQTNGFVRIDGTVNRLPIMEAWRRSSSVFWVEPKFSAVAMKFKVGNPKKDGYQPGLAMEFHPSRSLWRVYVPGQFFTDKCETAYKIESVDENNRRHVCGEGTLRVHAGIIDDPDDHGVVPDTCYAKFPDGKWRSVCVYTDSSGELAFTVSNVPVEEFDFEEMPSKPYAYNKSNGKFYSVSGFVDYSGEAFIRVGEVPDASGEVSYSKDRSTGFYYRVETFKDSSGEMSPKVGDKK